MAEEIPYERLGIPAEMRRVVRRDAPKQVRMVAARGLVPVRGEALLGILYALATDPDPEVAQTAQKTLVELPLKQVLGSIGEQTHPKVLEFLAMFRPPDRQLDLRILQLRATNDRTAVRIAERADAKLCEEIVRNHERLLLTPDIYRALYGNPNCSPADLARAESFLRLHHQLPDLSGESTHGQVPARAPMTDDDVDLEAEVMAALGGDQSPALLKAQQEDLKMFDVDNIDIDPRESGFSFDFEDDFDAFSFDLTRERGSDEPLDPEEMQSLAKQIRDMSVGERIKLAYLGNKEARSVLIRDPNNIVATAVVKSGRLTDSEVISYAANRNLADDVVREIAQNREWLRKYPVKVALVNNPKTPTDVAIGIVNVLNKNDLRQLAQNRNVPSVIFQHARRVYRNKYQKG